ncbi:MAG: hypothetical protein KBF93_14385 [Leptospiraceae bacterium]|nr:hypothetical protein [Leptospiraceae bacterium]
MKTKIQTIIVTLIFLFSCNEKEKPNLLLLALLPSQANSNITQTKKRISIDAFGNTINITFTDYANAKGYHSESTSIDLKNKTLSYFNSEGKLLNQTPLTQELFDFYVQRMYSFAGVAGAKELQTALEGCIFNRLTCEKPLPDTNRSFYDMVTFEGSEKMTFENAKWQESSIRTSDGGLLIQGRSLDPSVNAILQKRMTRGETGGGVDIAGVKISAEDITKLNSTINAIDGGCVRGNTIFYAAIGLGLTAATGNYFFFDQLSKYGNSQDKQECSKEEQLKKDMAVAAELERKTRLLIQERKEQSFKDGKELNEAEFPLNVLYPGNGGMLTVAYGKTIDFKIKSSVAASLQVSVNGYPVGFMEIVKGDTETQNVFKLSIVPEVGVNTISYSAQSTVGGKVKTGSLYFEVRR